MNYFVFRRRGMSNFVQFCRSIFKTQCKTRMKNLNYFNFSVFSPLFDRRLEYYGNKVVRVYVEGALKRKQDGCPKNFLRLWWCRWRRYTRIQRKRLWCVRHRYRAYAFNQLHNMVTVLLRALLC